MRPPAPNERLPRRDPHRIGCLARNPVGGFGPLPTTRSLNCSPEGVVTVSMLSSRAAQSASQIGVAGDESASPSLDIDGQSSLVCADGKPLTRTAERARRTERFRRAELSSRGSRRSSERVCERDGRPVEAETASGCRVVARRLFRQRTRTCRAAQGDLDSVLARGSTAL